MAAEASSAAIILSSSAAGMALSTTHVATGSILGSGVGKPGAEVRWAVAGRMAAAWLITLPAAARRRAVVLAVPRRQERYRCRAGRRRPDLRHPGRASGYMYWRAQQQKVDHNNVNADWDDTSNSVVPADERNAKVADQPTASV